MASWLLQLARKQMTFGQFAEKVEGLIAGNPAASSAQAAVVSNVKQGASNTIALVDVGADIGLDAALGFFDNGLDALTAKLGPVGQPIDQNGKVVLGLAVTALEAMIHTWALQQQARTASPGS